MPGPIRLSMWTAAGPVILGFALSSGAAAKSFVIPEQKSERISVPVPVTGFVAPKAVVPSSRTQGSLPPIGFSISTGGDVNASGYCEQLVGVPNSVTGGIVTVFYRSAGGTVNQTLFEPGQRTSYGQSVTAADVNGDGYTDIVVGDPTQDNADPQEGRVYVYQGTSLGVGGTPTTEIHRGGAYAYFGYSVSFAGDVNGDGYDDVIVGAPSYTDDQFQEGAAFLYLGGPTGLATTPVWEKHGDQIATWFGFDVSAAGDVNGDGYDDVLAGQPYYSNLEDSEGRVSLYFGGPGGLQSFPFQYESNVNYARLGWSVAPAGDANGDGYADFAAGAPNYSNSLANQGAVYLFPGSSVPLLGPPPIVAQGNTANDELGYDIAAGGDFNGDGLGDLIAGVPGYTNIAGNVGALYVMLGVTDLLYWPFSGVFSGTFDAGGYGTQVGVGSDTNGDGFADPISLEVGGILSPEGFIYPSMVEAHGFTLGAIGFGQYGLLAAGSFRAYLGAALAMNGDVNGDGFDDALVGGPYHSGEFGFEGIVQLHFGRHDGIGLPPPAPGFSPPSDWSFSSGIENANLGYSVAYAGDVNGDGYDDIIAGAPNYTNGQSLEGAAYVFYGSPGGTGPQPDWLVEGNQADGYFGTSVASAGDVNGDGFADVLVGAPDQSFGELNEGAAYLYYGSALGLSHSPARTYQSNHAGWFLGTSVAGIGDVDGDGLDDFALGVQSYTNGELNEGAALIYRGAFAGPGALWDTIESNIEGGGLGVAIASAGDMNGDGKGDLIAGMPDFSGGFLLEGRVVGFYGSSGGFATSPDWNFDGGEGSAYFGTSVSSAGDIDLDGYSDIIVGVPGTGGGSGEARVYLGGAGGPSPFPALYLSESAGGQTGSAVAGGGDFNGDGFGDVIAGSPLTAFSKGIQNGTVQYALPGILLPNSILDRPIDTFRPLADTQIGTGLRSDSPSGYRIRGRMRSPAGRTRVRTQLESKPIGTAFNGAGLLNSTWAKIGSPTSGTPNTLPASINVGGLAPNSKFHWRARYANRSIYFMFTPWFSPQANGSTQGDVRTAGGEHVVDVGDSPGGSTLALLGARPNPASSTTALTYALPHNGRVRLTLHDAAGRLVRRLLDRDEVAGSNSVAWDLRDDAGTTVAAGVYFARLEFERELRDSKVVVLP